MFAHRIVEYEGPEAVEWREVEDPSDKGLVIIEVVAAGVSFADLLQTRGAYQLRPQLPYSPGMDASGFVRSAPPESGLEAGQRVGVLLRHGCWQEVVAAPVSQVLALPDDVAFEGAALGLNYLTALFALCTRARAERGETLLVHGAAGGVGTASIQIGRALGLRTIAVVSDEGKCNFALANGAHEAVTLEGWLAAVEAIAGKRAVDIVLDPVGGDRVRDSVRSLAPGGRLVVVGFADGGIPTVKLNRLLLGNSSVIGAASLEYFGLKPDAVGDLWAMLMRLRTGGSLLPPPVEVFPFVDARGALRAIEGRTARGKVVLRKDS